jgi:diketogulonate reductase-like aldo/keto reductase
MDLFDEKPSDLTRRRFLKTAAAAAVSLGIGPWKLLAQEPSSIEVRDVDLNTRPIPSSGEPLPVVGLGTWQQFDVSMEPHLMDPLEQVLRNLIRTGGSVIDTSPMYGNAQAVLGRLLDESERREDVFLATKVWTSGERAGINQMNASMDKLGVSTVDLMQVHNLVDWETHLETLKRWKNEGRIRYTGVTHYTASAFDELVTVMENEPIDFVQLPYSIGFRRAERRLLPIARDRDIAVLVNRPFQAGSLFRRARGRSLPEWASELGIGSWAQYFLKFILGHPAVTTVIPGTSDPEHMLDNALAGTGPMPDESQRERMVDHWESA